MAEYEHGRWNIERLQSGWSFGSARDPDKKVSPYLVGWPDLDASAKTWDRRAVERFPALLAEAGLRVVRG